LAILSTGKQWSKDWADSRSNTGTLFAACIPLIAENIVGTYGIA
jgi:hypothetical protein